MSKAHININITCDICHDKQMTAVPFQPYTLNLLSLPLLYFSKRVQEVNRFLFGQGILPISIILFYDVVDEVRHL